jgi:hypothetical protein
MNHHRHFAYLLLAFGCMALAVFGFLSAGAAGSAAAAGGPAPRPDTPAGQAIPARPMPAGASGASFTLAPTRRAEYQVNLGALPLAPSGSPDNGTVGSPGTWFSMSPDVIRPGGTFASMGSGFAPLEILTYSVDGAPIGGGPFVSDGDGFTPPVALNVNAGSQSGYFVLTVTGGTSGKSASAVGYVQTNAPQVPALAVAPHAIRSGDPVHFFSIGYPANTAFNFALDGGTPMALMTDGNGRSTGALAVTAGTGGLVVNTYRTGVAGSMAGQSIEVRPDALQATGPAADLNGSRGFVDRAVVSSTVSTAFWFTGEGFQPDESVTLGGCGTGSLVADSNGRVRAPLIISATAGLYACSYTGGSSGRVAYAHVLAGPTAQDVPSALVVPSHTAATGGTLAFVFNHLAPNQGGTVFMDGLSGVAGNTTANGYGTAIVTKPNTPGGHAVFFIGNSGQVAVAPLFVLPNAGTATPTTTTVPGATSTATATPTTVPAGTGTATTTAVPGSTATATTVPGATSTATTVPGSTATATAPPVPATATATTCTAGFTDVPPSYWAYPYIQWAACQGIVSGYADHTFRPDNNTTRGQIAKMVVLAAGFPLLNPPTPHFSDVPVAHPFYSFIETAYAHNVISGYADGTFHPAADVTRGQLSKMVVLSQGLPVITPATPTFRDVPAAHPFYGYIETAVANHIVSGYTCGSPVEPCPGRYYRPNVSATRAQLSKMLYQAAHPAQR